MDVSASLTPLFMDVSESYEENGTFTKKWRNTGIPYKWVQTFACRKNWNDVPMSLGGTGEHCKREWSVDTHTHIHARTQTHTHTLSLSHTHTHTHTQTDIQVQMYLTAVSSLCHWLSQNGHNSLKITVLNIYNIYIHSIQCGTKTNTHTHTYTHMHVHTHTQRH